MNKLLAQEIATMDSIIHNAVARDRDVRRDLDMFLDPTRRRVAMQRFNRLYNAGQQTAAQ